VHPVAPSWVRVRLRTAPGAAAALALLVLVTAFLAAAVPRVWDRYQDAGLLRAVERATPARTTVTVTTPQPGLELSAAARAEALRPPALHDQYTKVLQAVGRPLVTDPDQSSYGVRTTDAITVHDPWIPRPSGLPAQIHLVAQSALGEHATVRTGRLPRADAPVTAASVRVEAAVTEETARNLHMKVGSVVHVPAVSRAPLEVRITGIVAPRTPDGAYWSTEPLLRTPALARAPSAGGDPLYYWLAALLLPPEAAPALLATSGHPVRSWQLAPVTDVLRARDLDGLTSAVAALEGGPGLGQVRAATDPTAEVSTELDDVLTGFGRLDDDIGPLVAVAVTGGAVIAGIVLLMAAGLAAERRRAELTLLRARGASLRGLTGRLLAETAVVAVPAGALGLVAALLAVPEGRTGRAVAAAAAVTALACAALPVRAAVAHRTVRLHVSREDTATVRPSRRRTVAELTLLVIAIGAVAVLRQRGVTGAGDQLPAAAPVLVGVIAALVLARLYPLLLRQTARPARRLRGAVGPLSLARAGCTSASPVLPLLVLLTALTTAAFGGSVLAGVDRARDHAALLAVGADGRIDSEDALPAGAAERVRRTAGVREVTEVRVDDQAQAGRTLTRITVAGVSPAGYAALARDVGLGSFPEQRLHRPAGSDGAPLPALASPSVARTHGTDPFPIRLSGGATITVRIVVVRDRTPAVPGTDFLVVDGAGLDAAAPRIALLLTGDRLDASALRRAAGDGAVVRLRAAERAAYADSPLQSGAERLYLAAVAASTGYAVLALILALLRAAPERTALLARLRTMGLTRSQGRRLLVLESLPQALLAAAGGALTGWAAIRLLSSGFDLTAVALPPSAAPTTVTPLRTDPLSLLCPAAAVLLLTVAVAAGQAWWTCRAGSVRELRAGDAR